MTEMVYYYDGSFEGLLCCIFDSYANKEVLTAIYRDEDDLPTYSLPGGLKQIIIMQCVYYEGL